jgi:hypothetical protein
MGGRICHDRDVREGGWKLGNRIEMREGGVDHVKIIPGRAFHFQYCE